MISMTKAEMAKIFASGVAKPGTMTPVEAIIAPRKTVITGVCDVCGKPVGTGRKTKCSEECMYEFNRERARKFSKANHIYAPNLDIRQCDICTVDFMPSCSTAILCNSGICEQARKRKLKAIAERNNHNGLK